MSKKEKKLSTSADTGNKKVEQHSKKQKHLMTGTIVILVITVISFVFVPALAGSAGSGGAFVFGRYANKPISFAQGNYFSRQVEGINNMYRDSLGSGSNVEFLRQLIWRSAFNQTVLRMGMLTEVENAGAGVSPRKVDRAVVNSGQFNENGAFSEDLYAAASGSQIKSLRDSLEEELQVQIYAEDAVARLRRSDKQLDYLLAIGSSEKSFSYAVYPYGAYPIEKVEEYGREKAKVFRKKNLNRITVTSSEKDAQEILEKLNDGLAFGELATNMSQDSFAENGGALGEVSYHNLLTYLDEEQADRIFDLDAEGLSGIIAAEGTYYIFQGAGSTVEADLASGETLASIRSYMEREEVGLIEDYLTGQAAALAAVSQANGLALTAAEQGVETGETGFIAPVYGNVSFALNSPARQTGDSILSSAAYSDDFFEKAFGLKTVGDISEPVLLDRKVVVFSLTGEQEATEYPEEYRDYVKNQLEGQLSNYKQAQLQSFFLESDQLKDNFDSAFSRIFSQS